MDKPKSGRPRSLGTYESVENVRQSFHKTPEFLFSDEVYFQSNGHVNKENCRYWSVRNPQGSMRSPPKMTMGSNVSARNSLLALL